MGVTDLLPRRIRFHLIKKKAAPKSGKQEDHWKHLAIESTADCSDHASHARPRSIKLEGSGTLVKVKLSNAALSGPCHLLPN